MKATKTKSTALALGCAAVLLGGMATQAQAAALTPGGMLFPAPGEAGPSGSVEQTISSPWAGSFIAGTLTSTVLSGDASNPHGGLTFTYEFTADADALHQTSQLTVGGFIDFLADVSYDSGSAGDAPSFFSRSTEGGGFGTNIRFAFSPGVAAGQSTALLVVRTDATTWDFSSAALINSESVTGVMTVAPVNVIPEPATIGLCLLGFASLISLRRFANRQ